MQHLDRDLPAVLCLLRHVDGGHATTPDLAFEGIPVGEGSPGGDEGVVRRGHDRWTGGHTWKSVRRDAASRGASGGEPPAAGGAHSRSVPGHARAWRYECLEAHD